MTYDETGALYPELVELLERLQASYEEKRPDYARGFVRDSFVRDGTVLIIGTESGEWFRGTEDVTKLFYWDWESWGRVYFGFKSDGWIRCNGTSAHIASRGWCVMDMDADTVAAEYLSGTMGSILDSTEPGPVKILEILRTAAHTYTQMEYGETYTWPIAFSAGAEKDNGRWRFNHMHFSIPTPSLPAIRGEMPSWEKKELHSFFRDIPD